MVFLWTEDGNSSLPREIATTIICASCSFERTLQARDVLVYLMFRLTVFQTSKLTSKLRVVLCLGVRQGLVEIWSCVAPTVGSAAFELLLLRGVVCYSATAHQSCGPAWPSCHKPCVCFKLRFPPLGLDDNCCCDRYEVRLESCLQLWFRFTSLLTLHSAMCNVHTSPQVQVLLFPAGRITQQEKTPRFEASSFYTGNYFLQQSANINESAQRFVLWKLVWVKEMVGWFCIFFAFFFSQRNLLKTRKYPTKPNGRSEPALSWSSPYSPFDGCWSKIPTLAEIFWTPFSASQLQQG